MHKCPIALPQHHTTGRDQDRYQTCALESVYPTLCEVGESESDDDGCNGALSGTDHLTHVDGDLAVRRLGRDNGTVGGSRRITVSDERISHAVKR